MEFTEYASINFLPLFGLRMFFDGFRSTLDMQTFAIHSL